MNAVHWNWSFGDGSTSTSQNTTHTYKELKTYVVTLEVTNQDGCKVHTTKEIIISPLWIPNAFSPNGDGKNDCFLVKYIEPFDQANDIYSIHIYNRWGQLVFVSDDINNSWNPRHHPESGSHAPSGVYVYIIKASNGTYTFTREGTVTLVR